METNSFSLDFSKKTTNKQPQAIFWNNIVSKQWKKHLQKTFKMGWIIYQYEMMGFVINETKLRVIKQRKKKRQKKLIKFCFNTYCFKVNNIIR